MLLKTPLKPSQMVLIKENLATFRRLEVHTGDFNKLNVELRKFTEAAA